MGGDVVRPMPDAPKMPYRTPDAPPKTRLPLLADLTVKTPCKVSWETMVGDDRMRFCCRCSKNVYDLTAMSEDEAESFLAVHLDDEDACVRLYRRADGRVLTTDCPVGAKKRHQKQVVLAASTAAVTITAIAAVVGDVNVPRAHSPLHSLHSRFEPPRSIPAPARAAGGTASDLDEPPYSPYSPYPHYLPTPPQATGTGQGFGREEPWGREEGSDPLRGPMPPASRVATLRMGSLEVKGELAGEHVARGVRQRFGTFRPCYENALRKAPHLAGRITTSFVIEESGSVAMVADAASDLADKDVIACVMREYGKMTFDAPEHGVVKVKVPILFRPGE